MPEDESWNYSIFFLLLTNLVKKICEVVNVIILLGCYLSTGQMCI